MNIIEEIGDEEFNYLLAEKYHAELVDSLKAIAAHISDIDIEEVVKNQIRDFIIITQNISKANSKELYLQNKKMCEELLLSNSRVVDALTTRLLPDTFDLIRFNGVTQSVKVNYKEANKITNGR